MMPFPASEVAQYWDVARVRNVAWDCQCGFEREVEYVWHFFLNYENPLHVVELDGADVFGAWY
jgi:hypothetical protein